MQTSDDAGLDVWSGATETRAFLFTDVESSTRRWEADPAAMTADLARHDALLRAAVELHAGQVIAHTGDGMCAAFGTATAALSAAIAGQQALQREQWRGAGSLRVRMGVHAGAAEVRDDNYFGPTLNRTARLMSLAAGGQVLCSQAGADLAADAMPQEAGLRDLGEHRLAGLARPERVFQLIHPDLSDEFPPLRAAVGANNLPGGLARFLGREAELSELLDLVRNERLITLWGAGGAGKTRLSLELAHRLLDQFTDGVWFVELAPVDRAELVPAALTNALGMVVGELDGAHGKLCSYLSTRQALLVLDNCEHLMDPVAELVQQLLNRCPAVRIVTSSRELLAVPGERAWSIPPMSLPAADVDPATQPGDAVTLFCDRAAAASAGFTLTEANAVQIVEICRRLDGIPLALELAAARVRTLGVSGVAKRLDDQFRVLTSGARTAPARHRTLEAAVDWSYQLLATDEREVLARLSVFRGTFGLAAAETVAVPTAPSEVDVVELIARLVDKSLLVGVPDAQGEVRYRLLETIRQYAADRLAAAGLVEDTRRRHLDHFLSSPRIDLGSLGWDGFFLIEETDNFEAALDWAIGVGDSAAAVRLAASLSIYWLWADAPQAADLLAEVLALPGLPRSVETAFATALLAGYRSDAELARRALQLVEEIGDVRGAAVVGYFAGHVGLFVGDADLFAANLAALHRAETIGFTMIAAWCHSAEAWHALATGDLAAAREHAERGVALCPLDRAPEARAHMRAALAVTRAAMGDADVAQALADEALRDVRGCPLSAVQSMALTWAAVAATLTGEWTRADHLLRELLGLLYRLGTARWLAEALECVALVLLATGRAAAARPVIRAVAAHRSAGGQAIGGAVKAMADALAAAIGEQVRMPAAASTDLRVNEDILLALNSLDAEVG